jgi:hypothetical protein
MNALNLCFGFQKIVDFVLLQVVFRDGEKLQGLKETTCGALDPFLSQQPERRTYDLTSCHIIKAGLCRCSYIIPLYYIRPHSFYSLVYVLGVPRKRKN